MFGSASLSFLGDNLLVHELRVIAAVELYLNAIYCVEHPVLKSVDELRQSVMYGKLFS